jgi:hypothetical protein
MPIDMRQLAEDGARARLADLQREIDELVRAFPALRSGQAASTPAQRGRRPASARNATPTVAQRRERKPMTAAQRKAVGERMRKYWAARRKAKAST